MVLYDADPVKEPPVLVNISENVAVVDVANVDGSGFIINFLSYVEDCVVESFINEHPLNIEASAF